MSTSYSAFCTDFYINLKVALKLDLPTGRETVLHLFDRVRREMPHMDRFRRYDDELSLESDDAQRSYSWASLRRTSVRSGWVNPDSAEQAYRLHRLMLDTTPYFLSISPLDIEHLELVFGFDFEAPANRDAVVFNALLADSPLAALVEPAGETVVDAQPFLGIALDAERTVTAFVEVKTRPRAEEHAVERFGADPISVYLTVRRAGGLRTLEECGEVFSTLAAHAERLADSRVVPHVVAPIQSEILGSGR
ncbi:MAG: hypothetical protein U0575_17250 [Phycisphaerales bacterium]